MGGPILPVTAGGAGGWPLRWTDQLQVAGPGTGPGLAGGLELVVGGPDLAADGGQRPLKLATELPAADRAHGWQRPLGAAAGRTRPGPLPGQQWLEQLSQRAARWPTVLGTPSLG